MGMERCRSQPFKPNPDHRVAKQTELQLRCGLGPCSVWVVGCCLITGVTAALDLHLDWGTFGASKGHWEALWIHTVDELMTGFKHVLCSSDF